MALAGAGVVTPCQAASGVSGRKPLVELPLRNDGGYLSVIAVVDGVSVRFVIDTGAEGGLITPALARSLSLRRDPASSSFVQGSRGGRTVPNLIVPSLALGDVRFGPLSVPMGALPGSPTLTPPVGGLLGADLLSRFDVEFDVPAGRLRLWALGSRLPPPWAAYELPALREGDRLRIEVRLDGARLMALLDSGARSRVVSEAVARQLGVSADDLARDPGGTTAGVDLHAVLYRWHTFRSLVVGGEHETAPVLTVSPLAPDTEMLLGSDWFAQRRVLIAYGESRLFVRRAGTVPHAGTTVSP
nr:retroviral-like aspartic protease family protein [Ameyamaea chiangmaiensis]